MATTRKLLAAWLFMATALGYLQSCASEESHAGIEAGNATIAGRVTDPLGRAVAGAIVVLYTDSAISRIESDSRVLDRLDCAYNIAVARDTTDSLGRYELGGLDAGAYTLQVYFENALLWQSSISTPNTVGTVELELSIKFPEANDGAPDISGSSSGTLTDKRDGQSYPWVKIGTQIWMARNLNYSGHDENGNRTYTQGWCYGASPADSSDHADATTCAEYGRLYRWETIMQLGSECRTTYCGSQVESPHRGICPQGWHVPTPAEYTQLDSFVRADQQDTMGTPFAARFLKASATDSNSVWNAAPFQSSDPYGFAAQPAGLRIQGATPPYTGLGHQLNLWTTEETAVLEDNMSGGAITYSIQSIAALPQQAGKQDYAISLRCLRD